MRLIFGLLLSMLIVPCFSQTEDIVKQDDRLIKYLKRILSEENKFYDSLFNTQKFPKNNVRAISQKGGKPFNFNLNKSYIHPNSTIVYVSKDLMKLLGGKIFISGQGNDFLIELHHLHDPDTSAIYDETNYSVLLKLPAISVGTIDLSGENRFAKLVFWQKGSFESAVESSEFSGRVTIIENQNNVVTGTLHILFKDSDKNDFTLTGEFQLPIVPSETFKLQERRIEKIASLEN